MQVDQLNAYNLMSLEAMTRRLQPIQFPYAEKAREAESKGVSGGLSPQVLGGLTWHAAP